MLYRTALWFAGLAGVILLAGGAVGAQTTWTGSTSTDWFTAGNWSSGVPGMSTDATIPSGPSRMPLVIYSGAVCKTLTIQSGATLSIQGGDVSVFGTCTNQGTMSFTTGSLQLTGDLVNQGTFQPGTGSLVFFGSGYQNLWMGSASFYNVSVSGGTVAAQGSINATHLSVSVFSNLDLGSYSHTIAGNCNLNGGITGTGTFVLTGTGTFNTGTSSVASVTVTGGIRTITGATVSLDLTLTGGTTRINVGTVNVLRHLVQQSSASLQVNSPGILDVSGDATLSGSVTMPAGKLICRGNWTSGSSFYATGGTVQFSNGAADILATGSVFFHVDFLPLGPKTLKSALRVNGKLTVSSSARVDIGSFTHRVAGGLDMSGTLTGSGVLELDDQGDFRATPNGVARVVVSGGPVTVTSTARVLTRLQVKSGGELQATTGTLTVDGSFDVDAGGQAGTNPGGVFDLNGAVQWNGACTSTGGVIRAAAGWTSAAAFAPTSGIVELDGGPASVAAQGSFHQLRITAGVRTTTLALDVNAGLEVASGATLNAGAFSHTVAGDLKVEGTVAGTGVFDLDGIGDLRVTTSVPEVAVSGGPITVNTLAVVSGRFTVASTGTFTMTQGTLKVSGDLMLQSAIAPTGGIIELAGGAATVTGVGSAFADLTVSGGPKTLANVFTVSRKLTVASGATLDLGFYTHAVGGGLDMAGTLVGTGLLDLTGPGSLAASAVVPKLRISGGPVSVSALARIQDPLEVTAAGRVDVNTGGDLRVAGDVQWAGACQSTGGILRVSKHLTITGTLFVPTGGTVRLEGSGIGTLSPGGAVFQSLEIAEGAKTMDQGSLAFAGTLDVVSGSFTTTGRVTLSPRAGAGLRVQSGAILKLHGDSWAQPVVVAGHAGGRWSFEVQGTLGLRHFVLTDLDTNGLHLNGGGFENDPDLGNGILDQGAAGGAYLQFTGFTQTRTLKNVWFKTDPGTSAVNVRYTGPAGQVVFEDALGPFKGQAHEADPSSRVDWTLGAATSLRLTEIFQDTPQGVEVTAPDVPVDLDGRALLVSKAGGTTATLTLPLFVVNPGDYVELREGSGASGPLLAYLGASLPWSVGGGGAAALLNGPGAGLDFVRWGGSAQASPAGTSFTDARGSLPAPAAGQSLGRDQLATDTDTREDWDPGCGQHATYPTRGARNLLFGLPYVWQGGETPSSFTVETSGAGNLWHLDTRRYFNPTRLSHEAGPPPDVDAWAFNSGSPNYSYATGARATGSLRSPPVRLPAVSNLRLSYFEWLATENAAGKDQCMVEVRQLGTSAWNPLATYTGVINTYTIRTLDVSAYQGKDVEFRWTFDSMDGSNNQFEGWYVDYIAVYEGSQGLPLVAPGQNSPPPPPPPPTGDLTVAGTWSGAGPSAAGSAWPTPSIRLAFAGPNALGLEIQTGLYQVVKKPGDEPGTTRDVVEFQGLPPALQPFVTGDPYPEFHFPLPVVPGLRYAILPIEAQRYLLPATGMPAGLSERPAFEVLPGTATQGPRLVIRPFGQEPESYAVHRHTVRLVLVW